MSDQAENQRLKAALNDLRQHHTHRSACDYQIWVGGKGSKWLCADGCVIGDIDDAVNGTQRNKCKDGHDYQWISDVGNSRLEGCSRCPIQRTKNIEIAS